VDLITHTFNQLELKSETTPLGPENFILNKGNINSESILCG